MLGNVSKWGNSLGVRIPRALADQIGIAEGEPIELIVEDNHLLIQKVYRLENLLSQVSAKNIHSEEDTGSPVGKEIW